MPAESPLYFGDSESYWELAQTIARGEPYQFRSPDRKVFRTPGYPALLSLAPAVFGEDPPHWAGRLLTAACGTLAVLAAYCLAQRVDERAALPAAAVVAVYPGAIVMSGLLLTEAPFSALMLVQLALWHATLGAVASRRTAWLALATGLTAAAATSIRPSWLLFTPLMALLLIATGRRKLSPRALVVRHAIVLAGMIVGLAPWWIRNGQEVGRFVPTTLTVGASLYDGLNPQATGASDMRFEADFVQRAKQQDDGSPLELRLDGMLRDAAWRWAQNHPADAVKLAGTKLARMWNPWPNEPALSTWPVRVILLLTYGPVLVLAIVGAWRLRFVRPLAVLLCLAPAVYFSALHMIFVSSIRYRQPAMLALVVLAAAAVIEFWSGGATRRWQRRASAAMRN